MPFFRDRLVEARVGALFGAATVALMLILIVTACLFWSEPSAAQGLSGEREFVTAPQRGSPLQVGVDIEIDQITFIDQKEENFGVVATIRMQWNDPALAFDEADIKRDFRVMTSNAFVQMAHDIPTTVPTFVVQNQQDRSWIQESIVVVHSDGNVQFLERFSVTLQAPYFDFRRYPFDTQRFFFEVVSVYPDEFVEFVALNQNSGLGDMLGNDEWNLGNDNIQVSSVKGISGLESSKIALAFEGQRHIEYYLLRIFLPLLVLVFVTWATFFLDEYRRRIEVTGGLLLVFVAFNFAISGEIPKLGYITLMDFILFWMFIITGSIIIFNVALRRLKVAGNESLARRIDNYVVKWIYPISWIAIIAFTVYFRIL